MDYRYYLELYKRIYKLERETNDMNLYKIPIAILKEMNSKGFIEITPYIHKNFLVRWLFWKRLRTALNLSKKAERVLDFGAGSGIFMPSLSKNFKEVYSLDLDTRALEYVKDRFKLENVKIIKGEKDVLPFKDDFFDIIFATDVLEHFKDSYNIQKEFKRVLKKDGILIVSSPTENLMYVLARKFMYKRKKPADHYTNVYQIMNITKKFFKIENIRTIPTILIPAFKIYRAIK